MLHNYDFLNFFLRKRSSEKYGKYAVLGSKPLTKVSGNFHFPFFSSTYKRQYVPASCLSMHRGSTSPLQYRGSSDHSVQRAEPNWLPKHMYGHLVQGACVVLMVCGGVAGGLVKYSLQEKPGPLTTICLPPPPFPTGFNKNRESSAPNYGQLEIRPRIRIPTRERKTGVQTEDSQAREKV